MITVIKIPALLEIFSRETNFYFIQKCGLFMNFLNVNYFSVINFLVKLVLTSRRVEGGFY